MSKIIFRDLPTETLRFNQSPIPIITVNQEKLDIDIKHFLENDIILIRSGTGTSKTKLMGRLCPQIVGKDNRLLSIVNLINLSKEQIGTFNKESKTILLDYQTTIDGFNYNNGVICINSLIKLYQVKEENGIKVDDYNLSNKILYIDEINDLLETLTHNGSIDPILNQTYNYLIKIIKNCKKIILSDATINQNTINFLSSIDNKNKKIVLIHNEFKKFQGIEAIYHQNKLEFIDELKKHIKDKKHFLFACDLRGEITTIYTNLISEFKEQKDDFILITSETDFQLKDASEQFKDKFIFYSPSIKTGVSYINIDEKQDQFLYISNKRLISPDSFYQMSARTRNMSKLICYYEHMNDIECKFETIKELENKYKNLINTNEKLLNLSKSTNENDEVKIVNNSFFKMWTYTEYKKHIFNTGFITHLKNILSNAGFINIDASERVKLSKQQKGEMKEAYVKYTEDQFQGFLEYKYTEETEKLLEQNKKSKEYKDFIKRKEEIDNLDDDEFLNYITKENAKYKILLKRHDMLGLKTRDDAEATKNVLSDEYSLRNYFNVLGLFKTSEYIRSKLESKIEESFKIKTYNNVYNKISLIEKFEKHYKIKRFDFKSFENIDIKNEFSDKNQELYNDLFDSVKQNFKDKHELILIYLNMLRSVAGGKGGIPIIERIKTKIKVDNKWKNSCVFRPNIEMITSIINMAKNKNPELKHYNLDLVKALTGIEPSQKIVDDLFKDEEEEYVSYLFNKTTNKALYNKDNVNTNSYFNRWSKNYDEKNKK